MNASDAATLLASKKFPRKTSIVTAGSWLLAELLRSGMTEAEALAMTKDALRILCERRVSDRLLGRA